MHATLFRLAPQSVRGRYFFPDRCHYPPTEVANVKRDSFTNSLSVTTVTEVAVHNQMVIVTVSLWLRSRVPRALLTCAMVGPSIYKPVSA